jgi:hypothetical protein
MNGSRATLSDSDLQAALELIRDADSVELKLTLPQEEQRSAIDVLRIDPLKAQIRQVFFLDTPDLQLNRAGLAVRVRRVQGRDGDSVIKLRPVVPSDLPRGLRTSPEFNVEVDAMPGGFVCSASFKGITTNKRIREAALTGTSLDRLFSKRQQAFFADQAPSGLRLGDLSLLGPIFVLKTKWVPQEAVRPMVAELWLYPDGSRVLELSTKCRPDEAFEVAARARSFLTQKGINLSGPQETKTRNALNLLTARAA